MQTIKLLSGFFAFLLAGSTVLAQNRSISSFDFNLTAGTIFPGKVQASYDRNFDSFLTVDFNIRQALLIKASADYNLWKYLSIGVALNYVPIKISDNDFRELGIEPTNIHMSEIDGVVKGRLWAADNLLFKPYAAIGYRHTFSNLKDAREHGFCLNGGIETLLYFNPKYFISCDLGFFSQPYGGVIDVAHIRAAPIFFAGIGFGFRL
jgi:hypothetical protein